MTRIIEMTSKSTLLIILLAIKMIDARITVEKQVQGSEKLKGFNRLVDRSILENDNLVNLDNSLDFVVNHSEFQPLALSIGRFGSGSKIVDRVTKYLRKRVLDHYEFDLDKMSVNSTNLQKGITWIIVVDEFHNLKIHIGGDTDLWNASNKFFIIFIGKKDNETTNDWMDIFKTFWNRHRICKVLIVSIHDNFRYLYRYSPFVKSNEEFGVVQRLDTEGKLDWAATDKIEGAKSKIEDEKCLLRENSTRYSAKLFEDFRDLNDYPVYITIFASQLMNITTDENNETTYTMLDANVMNLVQERMRSKFRIEVLALRDDGDPFEDALDAIAQGGVSEVVFTGYFTKRYWRDFEFTASVFQDKLCLIAPSSEQLPKFLVPFLPFTKELWFLLIIYNLCVAIIWSLIQRIDSALRSRCELSTVGPAEIGIKVCKNSEPKRINNVRLLGFEDYPEVIKSEYFKRPYLPKSPHNSKPYSEPPEIHSCLIRSSNLLSVACHPLYGGKTCTERAFLFGSLFFALIVIGLYQSCLVSSFSKPSYYPELNSLLDVVKFNRTIITKYNNLMEHTFPEGSPVTDRLRKMTKVSTSHEKTYDMVAYRGFVSLGRRSSFTLENLTAYYDDEGNKSLLHMVQECPATYALSYVGRLFSPYLERIDSLLLRMQQAGFIKKWYSEMVFRAKLEQSRSIPKRREEHIKLTVEHLWLTFLGLGIGLFCSTIVFLWELHYAGKLRCPISSNRHMSSPYMRQHIT